MSQQQLAEILGNKGNVSIILNKKRRLSLEMIRKLSENIHLPAEILIKEYPLELVDLKLLKKIPMEVRRVRIKKEPQRAPRGTKSF